MEKKQKKKYIQIIILSIAIIVFATSIIFTSAISKGIKNVLFKSDIRANEEDLVVHFVDVGQGDAIAITFPNGKVMIIDSGPKDSQNKLVEYIKNNIISSNNDLTIDYAILTHSDLDHSGGMSALFGEFEIKTFFRPNIASKSENSNNFAIETDLLEYDELIKLAQKEKGLEIYTIDEEYRLFIEDVLVEIFPPIKKYDTTNEMSPIIKISYLNKSFLFTGDIQGDSENDMLNYYGTDLDADVLKVAHHGSNTSTSEQFAQMVSPKYAVICVGSNTYGHPHLSVISTLQDVGAKVYTTQNSSVRIVCGPKIFGLLNEIKIQSYEFVDWWIIALVVDIILILYLIKVIVQIVIERKKQNKI